MTPGMCLPAADIFGSVAVRESLLRMCTLMYIYDARIECCGSARERIFAECEQTASDFFRPCVHM